ncbi:hypothetical protein GY26_17035 [Gammaproteobacteria bacterium MFB021]|nr:hypothetical protein GY26_17035 [Gammaproteobacteria bacterium MFB021]
MEWFAQNSRAITAVSSLFTLFVWIFYAQILYRNFARTRRPRIIINRGHGNGLGARCLISNMSSEPIFLEHVIVSLHTSEGWLTKDLIDEEVNYLREAESDSQHVSSQGPMLSGSFSHIGTFRAIIQQICRGHDIDFAQGHTSNGAKLHHLDVRVVAIYGSEDHPIGAARRFRMEQEGDGDACVLVPVSIDTKRYASRLQRWRVRQWIRRLD